MLDFPCCSSPMTMALVIENCDHVEYVRWQIMELGQEGSDPSPFHPYTMGLKNSFPNILDRRSELISIPGVPPVLMAKCGLSVLLAVPLRHGAVFKGDPP